MGGLKPNYAKGATEAAHFDARLDAAGIAGVLRDRLYDIRSSNPARADRLVAQFKDAKDLVADLGIDPRKKAATIELLGEKLLAQLLGTSAKAARRSQVAYKAAPPASPFQRMVDDVSAALQRDPRYFEGGES